MEIFLPTGGLVLCIGPSNSGKSTWLQKLVNEGVIKRSEVVSSDGFRELVSDEVFIDWTNHPKDEADSLMNQYQQLSKEAFTMMDRLVETRAKLNKLTFIDATHLHPDDRARYRKLAEGHHVPIIALVFDADEEMLLQRDEKRENPRGKRRIKQQYQTFKREKRFLKKENYQRIYILQGAETPRIIRQASSPLQLDVGHGLDIIGDIHGCFDESLQLLDKLGYLPNAEGLYMHPEGRKFLSLGDIMSRGPKSLDTLQFFYEHVEAGLAYMIDSNHGWKIARWLDGKKVTLNHGDEKVEQDFQRLQELHGKEVTDTWKKKIKKLLLQAPSHYVLTKHGVETAVCVHAGIRDEWIGKQSATIRDFCRYGDTDGFDEEGKPIRKDWTIQHSSNHLIIWGHDPKKKPLLMNQTINIDQGVVFGGELTAFRYPEKQIVAVKAKRDYSDGARNPLLDIEKQRFNPPNIAKFIEGYSVLAEEIGEVHISKSHVIPAFDAVSHVTLPLEELVYIPPTMSPTPSPSSLDSFLEHPKEAINYYRQKGVHKMVAEKKHMGSRAVLLLFKNESVAKKYVDRETLGIIYTRTGRRFFQEEMEQEILEKLHRDLAPYYQQFETDFVLLDAEIMPWNLKAKELINLQYAHVAENARLDRMNILKHLEDISVDHDVSNWKRQYEQKLEQAEIFEQVFQKYCWEIDSIHEVQIAPFHLLADSNQTFFQKSHLWHMEKNHEFAKLSELFVRTEYKVIEDEKTEAEVTRWWTEMTADGHEGIVIKPEYFLHTHKGKLVQPAIKVRGQKYLHIIYGIDYLEQQNLERLKKRNVSKKQKLALKEFALGLEGIRRFVEGESLERVHECVLGTLALEKDPVDPRL